MSENEILRVMLGIGALLLFLLIILVFILIIKVPTRPEIRRNIRDEVRKIKEQIESPEED